MSIKILDVEYLSILETSKIMKLSYGTILKYVKENKIKGLKIGMKYYTTHEAIIEYLKH